MERDPLKASAGLERALAASRKAGLIMRAEKKASSSTFCVSTTSV
jgi:hypothetical protein